MLMDSSVAYKRALQEMTVYDFVQVDVPLFSRQDDAMGSLDDIPLKDLEGKYLAKIVVDLVQDVPLDSVNFSQLEEGMLQKQYDGLPPPFGPKVTVSMPYKLQIAHHEDEAHTLRSTQVLLLRSESQHTTGQ